MHGLENDSSYRGACRSRSGPVRGRRSKRAAGQTLQLTQSNATVLRRRNYADKNLSADLVLSTRASSDPTYVRRIVLKFDTETPLPAGTPIISAILTLTVAGGNPEARTLSAFRVNSSYESDPNDLEPEEHDDPVVPAPAADLAERYATAAVTNAVGSRITIDVTALVQASVKGTFGSRYSRIALVDQGSSSRDSYKEYFSERAADGSTHPLLHGHLWLGRDGPAPQPAPTPAPAPLPLPRPRRLLRRPAAFNSACSSRTRITADMAPTALRSRIASRPGSRR